MTRRTRSDTPVLVRERAAGGPVSMSTWVMAGTVAVLAGLTAMTQFLAGRFHHAARLGAPLYRLPEAQCWTARVLAMILVGLAIRLAWSSTRRRAAPALLLAAAILWTVGRAPLYHPLRLLEWWPQLSGRAEFQPLLRSARAWGLAVAALTGAGMLYAASAPRKRGASHSHGSARWGTGDELRRGKADAERMRRENGRGNGGLLVGRHADGSLLWYPGASHVLTMAPTRAGKGVGTIVPNLLTYPGSVLCTDPKAENFAITARQRRVGLGQQVYALDPFGETLAGGRANPMRARFNPMRSIETLGPRGSLARDDAQTLAEALILSEEGGKNRHWTDEGRTVVMGVMVHVCHTFDSGLGAYCLADTPYGRDLLTVRHLLTLPRERFESLLEDMAESSHPVVRKAVSILTQKAGEERSGVMSSAQSQLAFLDSPAMAEVLAERVDGRPNPLPEADLFSIKTRPMTAYLVIPAKFLESHAAWLRVMIVVVNDIITRSQKMPRHRILFLLDEFANLGRMDAIRRGISLVGGYGVAFWLVVQDLSQAELVYDKGWKSIEANTDVKQLFATNDTSTAREVSEKLGKTTVYADSGNTGRSADASGMTGKGSSHGENATEKERPLLYPDEVLRLDPRLQILMVRGHDPMRLPKLDYREMDEVASYWDPNPMHAG